MSTKVDTYQQPQETVEGGVGPADSPADAVEVAGQRPALPRVEGAALPKPYPWLQQQTKKFGMIG
ncbi:hypothetical protein [Stenotrophomonas sp. BR163]|uniref:hypothetical protein n=1 Tax=Stenotrophomonas sp. BR163 TaxID=3398459 RepID=UPI0039C6F2D8